MTDTLAPGTQPPAIPDPAVVRASPFATAPGAPPRFQIAWDSTSLGLLKECPRKYYYEIILGWRPRGQSVHLKFGQLYHAGLEAYDHFCASIGKLDNVLTDAEHNEAVRLTILRALSLSGERIAPECASCGGTGHIVMGHDSDAALITEPCELCAGTGRHGDPVWTPWVSTDAYKNLWTLVRSLVWYCDTFRNRGNAPMTTALLSNGKPAVELSFYFPVGDVNGIAYGMCGHLDRVVIDRTANDRKAVHDRKTTKSELNARYFNGFSPHNQFTLYTAASAIHYDLPPSGVTVDAAQILVSGTRFARQFIPFPPAVVDEWFREAQWWIASALRYAEEGFWPRNDKSCGNYGGCPFAKVCSKSPAFRQAHLEADFTVSRWNPLEVRGDI